jgi:predicted metal-dependent HD superfamily phosphohydrolase
MKLESWQAMLHVLGATPEQECYRALVDAYAESHRAYHTGQHVSDCLALLKPYASLAVRPSECECACGFTTRSTIRCRSTTKSGALTGPRGFSRVPA